jgi:hypothetical protein
MNDEPPPGRISPADALEAVLSAESHEHLEAICEVLEELEDEPEDETDDEDTSPRDMAAVAAYQKARDKRTWAEIERRRAAKGKQPRQ